MRQGPNQVLSSVQNRCHPVCPALPTPHLVAVSEHTSSMVGLPAHRPGLGTGIVHMHMHVVHFQPPESSGTLLTGSQNLKVLCPCYPRKVWARCCGKRAELDSSLSSAVPVGPGASDLTFLNLKFSHLSPGALMFPTFPAR